MKTNKNISTNNNRIAILGAGESGVGAAILAQQKGFEVFVSDFGKVADKYALVLNENKIAWEEGKHSESEILNAVEIIKSPGIPDTVSIIKKAVENGISIVNEIEFASRYTDAFIVAVTGSNGKTTVTSWIYDAFVKDGRNAGLGGNIGKSFALQVAQENYDYYVLELSSFQLDNCYQFRPNIAVLVNISPDHLDRYNYKYENYIASKFRITQAQTADDLFVYCADDEATLNYLAENKIQAKTAAFSIKNKVEQGAYLENEEIKINLNNKTFNMSIHKLGLVGQHNIYNSMAQAIVGKATDLKKDAIRESLQNFKNLEHRMEKVLKVGGIQFINDSKATNVNSTWYALESTQASLVWIAGGVDKGNDYDALKHLVDQKVHTIICLGKDNRNLHKAFGTCADLMINVQSMDEAVKVAHHFANKGDSILLSPACASFDLFKNYEDRGTQFKKAVKNL